MTVLRSIGVTVAGAIIGSFAVEYIQEHGNPVVNFLNWWLDEGDNVSSEPPDDTDSDDPVYTSGFTGSETDQEGTDQERSPGSFEFLVQETVGGDSDTATSEV